MKEQLQRFVRQTDGPLGVAIVVVSLVAIIGWQYTRAQLGGRPQAKRASGLGVSGLAVAVLTLAVARVAFLK